MTFFDGNKTGSNQKTPLRKRGYFLFNWNLSKLVLTAVILGSIEFFLALPNLSNSSAIAETKHLEYISFSRAEELLKKFEAGQSPKAGELDRLELVCDMFGFQSRLQAEKSMRLYSFVPEQPMAHSDKDRSEWRNLGAQVTKKYDFKDQRFVGRKGSFQDELRKTSSTEWVSQLSYQKAGQSTKKVIAVSLCYQKGQSSSPLVQASKPLHKANL